MVGGQLSILFFQSTSLGSKSNQIGLFDLLLTHLDSIKHCDVFDCQQIVVSNHANASWLKDRITLKDGVCANLDFVVLLGPVLQNIYLEHNPDVELFDLSKSKYIIYKYLCDTKVETSDSDELNNYIYNKDGEIDHYRTYQLSSQLASIIAEYIYLRTEDMINLKDSKFKSWQKLLIKQLFNEIGSQKTFLDIYDYFITSKNNSRLPKQLFIFGLTSIYQSQLKILLKLAPYVDIYWYYISSSNEYYGDLLSDATKSKLEKGYLREPDLSLNDLYLVDGNPLLANLGQQSREFIELLNAHDIDIYTFNGDVGGLSDQSTVGVKNSIKHPKTILKTLQDDILHLRYRVREEYRLSTNNAIYASPITLAFHDTKFIYDLPNKQNSIKVNICHNRMREVQVMFNEIVSILKSDNPPSLSEILITAPDIDNYVPYIQAVFTNEFAIDAAGTKYKLPFNITGQRKYSTELVLETIKTILDAPYLLNVNYFIEIITQSVIQESLHLNASDIDLAKKWLSDNHTNFGYDKVDYEKFGYYDYPIHSFKHFLDNLVLGACMGSAVFNDRLPLYYINNSSFTPYDNLDNSQLELCNKLILLIELLNTLRQNFYDKDGKFKELSVSVVHEVLTELCITLIADAEIMLHAQAFLGSLLKISSDTIITLPILKLILDEYMEDFKSTVRFNGAITAASMRYMRNIPFECVYVLGLNFGEYPVMSEINQLSILAHEWRLADRNYNIESRQTFLDLILTTRSQLYLSYIGRTETDNKLINPSPVLGLFLTTLGQSFTNFWLDKSISSNPKYDYKNLVEDHSLHPFYNNTRSNYFWALASNLLTFNEHLPRFDFANVSQLAVDSTYYNISLKELQNTFLYTNYNLYRVLKVDTFDNDIELFDIEDLSLINRETAKEVFCYLDKYENTVSKTDLHEYLMTRGILGYMAMGDIQFEHYCNLYKTYTAIRGTEQINLVFSEILSEQITLNFNDMVWCEDKNIIVIDSFERLRPIDISRELPYHLRMRAMIILAIIHKCQLDLSVVIRIPNTDGTLNDIPVVLCDSEKVLIKLLKYYVRSLSNPVLIHKNAINEYVKQTNSKWPVTLADIKSRVQATYMADYNNYELDNLKKDVIFANVATEYFNLIEKIKGHNDIYSIGDMLSKLIKVTVN